MVALAMAYLAFNSVGYFLNPPALGIVTLTDFLGSVHALFCFILIEITTRIYTRGTNKVNKF